MTKAISHLRTPYGEITYTLEYKKVKNINLRIAPDGEIRLSAPRSVPIEAIEAFVARHAERIIAHQNKQAQKKAAFRAQNSEEFRDGELVCIKGELLPLRRFDDEHFFIRLTEDALLFGAPKDSSAEERRCAYDKYAAKEAEMLCNELCQRAQRAFSAAGLGDFSPTIRLRSMKTRWGVCNPGKNQITLNTRLYKLPEECGYYVVIHEFAHLLQANHSDAFYAVVSEILPNWREIRRRLRQYE